MNPKPPEEDPNQDAFFRRAEPTPITSKKKKARPIYEVAPEPFDPGGDEPTEVPPELERSDWTYHLWKGQRRLWTHPETHDVYCETVALEILKRASSPPANLTPLTRPKGDG